MPGAKRNTKAATAATIYHNPRCSTSRKVLAALKDAGIEPTIVEYLKTPPKQAELKRLLAMMGAKAQDIVRRKEPAFKARRLGDEGVSEAELIAAIAEEPILLERPIVITAKGAKVCRPADTVRELLP